MNKERWISVKIFIKKIKMHTKIQNKYVCINIEYKWIK